MNNDEPLSGGRSRTQEFSHARLDLADIEREQIANEREAALDLRELRIVAHEASADARVDEVKVVLDDAATRDTRADERDARADERECAASLDAFVHPDADQYTAAIRARRASAIDRAEARSDRLSSAEDRSDLSDS
jgi:hypothetical protein